MKRTIKDLDLKNKRVIIRCDLNVPMDNGVILDDNKIKESLETIKYAIKNKVKIILMSHLGKVKSEEDKLKNTLKPVSVRLSELLGQEVKFSNVTRGTELEELVSNLGAKEVLLMENTRFEDLDGKKESSCDMELSRYWASLGEVFINDAYGTSHRKHASNVGIASYLPNAIGFLVEKELNIVGGMLENPERPLTVILGGAKVEDKIGVIENLVTKADRILIGGGMAFTFLQALGYNIGKSMLDEASIDFCKRILAEHNDKIVLPVDYNTGLDFNPTTITRIASLDKIRSNEIGMDIGPVTIKLFEEELKNSASVIWNGPLGVFEFDKFNVGTKKICEVLSKTRTKVIIGGGESASAVIKFGYKDKFYHISTGGGATLELLEGKVLPGIDIIEDK